MWCGFQWSLFIPDFLIKAKVNLSFRLICPADVDSSLVFKGMEKIFPHMHNLFVLVQFVNMYSRSLDVIVYTQSVSRTFPWHLLNLSYMITTSILFS